MKNLINKTNGILFAWILLTGSISTANAQKAEFGVRLMPTFSTFDLKTSGGNSIKGEVVYGFGVGAFFGFNFTDNVGIQIEGIYNSINQKYKEVDVERKVNLRYVNIPLLLSLNTGKSRAVNLNVVAGPQIGLSVGSSVTTTGSDGVANSKAVLAVKKGDLGLAYGARLDFGLNSSHTVRLGLGFRGVFGLIDISDNSETMTTDSYYILDKTKIKTYSGYLGLSILF